MTVRRVHAAHGWILPVAAMVVSALAVGAAAGWLVWDEPITRWMVDSRTEALNDFFRRVSFLGSTPVVVVVSLLAAAASWRRCPRLADRDPRRPRRPTVGRGVPQGARRSRAPRR